jgi:hypothetical protein
MEMDDPEANMALMGDDDEAAKKKAIER